MPNNTPELEKFCDLLGKLHHARRNSAISLRAQGKSRQSLTNAERATVLAKSAGRCHICGGLIEDQSWEADHVFAHSAGGAHQLDNYLPAHSLCNNYRWNYGTEEFQLILKLGVWLRTQIERRTPVGLGAGRQFLAHESRRARRRHGHQA